MNITPEIRKELGRKRGEVTLLIRYQLRKLGYRTDTEFAERVLKRSKVCLHNTITGKKHSYRVLDALREAGVSEEYLFDPRRVQQKQANHKPQEEKVA